MGREEVWLGWEAHNSTISRQWIPAISTRSASASRVAVKRNPPEREGEFDVRESDGRKAFGDVSAIDRDENAPDVDDAMQQVVFDFER